MSDPLASVREVWAQRTQARSRSDVLYLLYAALMGVLVIGAPLLHAAGAFLARPDVLPALLHPAVPTVLTGLCAGLGAVMVMIGAVRGPALLPPFFTATLADSGIRRRRVLRRPFARALLLPVLGSLTLAALIAATLLSAGRTSPAPVLWWLLAALGTGLLLGSAWLAGELLEPLPRRLLALGLLLGGVLAAALPSGAGPAAVFPVDSSSPGAAAGPAAPGAGSTSGPAATAWAIGLLGAGLLAVGAGTVLLDTARGRVLREQAARWESATTVATTGDMVGAAGAFRTPPTAGRRLPAVGPGSLPLLYARRDAVAWLRSPERTAVGALITLLAAAVLTGSTLLTGPLSWGAALLGATAMWAGSGPYTDGIRHAVHTAGAPTLFGQTTESQALLHAIAPTLALALLTLLGSAATLWMSGTVETAELSGLLLPLALLPILLAGRVRDAAKGAMPLGLMTPMPTPQGDLSVLPLLAWQSDAILLALAAGVLLAALVPLGPGWLLAGAALTLAGMTLMARARLLALRS